MMRYICKALMCSNDIVNLRNMDIAFLQIGRIIQEKNIYKLNVSLY